MKLDPYQLSRLGADGGVNHADVARIFTKMHASVPTLRGEKPAPQAEKSGAYAAPTCNL